MSARYAPLPNPRSAPDAQREMEDAFESDNEDDGHNDHESTPLNLTAHSRTHSQARAQEVPGAYDFEREYEYDFPPPGSPPAPSSTALPNDIGNSNGQLPSTPIRPSMPGPSFFRRAVGAILPTHYARVPVDAQGSRARGGGIENDGVFANVMAKPQVARTIRTEDGNIHMVPEDNQKEAPPSYVEAQADAVPPYWETTVHAPGIEPGADMIIDDLPTGSFWVFVANAFISVFFQFVGFLLTHILATSHAGRYGARAGLGLTLIQFGFYSREINDGDVPSTGEDGKMMASRGDGWALIPSNGTATMPDDTTGFSITSKDWLSFLFMTLGWFLLLSSIIGFWRMKRWEAHIRSPPAPITPEDVERDIAIRRNIENVFGISFGDNETPTTQVVRDEQGNVVVIPGREALEEVRLQRDLRAAGLL
ncbi:hypothetical protein BDQ12DRAFT_628147 [Crucibulum laeve]|uniref:Metal homeostatis protein bsd2 n=1 Tax=Crucibulum laeve TaxID=68775 RepID=A0A5C3M4E3_9AGAR|nr:hypothetical protein BDQ12DRAFT_628147 [Crucibulum laeve]